MSPSTSDPISVSLITGFLGSGKTTLLNHLLANPEMDRTAVIVNEFGEVGLDHLMVREIDEGTVLLKSGCICCTVQGELVDGLKELYVKRLAGVLPLFTRVAIETTGLADPLPIITCLMGDPLFKHVYRLDGLVTTVEAVHGEAQFDRHVEAVRQAAVADRLVITKSDLADQSSVARLRVRLGELNPGATIITAEHGRVQPSQLFNAGLFDPATKSLDVQRWLNEEAYEYEESHSDSHPSGEGLHDHGESQQSRPDLNRHDEHIASFCLTLDEPMEWEAFKGWYEEFAVQHGDQILRLKGIVNIRTAVRPFVIHCVQSMQHSPTQLPAWPSEDRRSRIVFITHDLSRERVEISLRRHLAQSAATGTESGNSVSRREARDLDRTSNGRWLNDAEIGRLFAALATQDDREAADALRLMLLTGVACVDVWTACWEDFDLGRKVWLKPLLPIPASKVNPRPARIPLGEAAMALLTTVRERALGVGWLFGDSYGAISPDRLAAVWTAATRAADIDHAFLEEMQPVLAVGLFQGLSPELTRSLLGLNAHGSAT